MIFELFLPTQMLLFNNWVENFYWVKPHSQFHQLYNGKKSARPKKFLTRKTTRLIIFKAHTHTTFTIKNIVFPNQVSLQKNDTNWKARIKISTRSFWILDTRQKYPFSIITIRIDISYRLMLQTWQWLGWWSMLKRMWKLLILNDSYRNWDLD